ncbi:MAG TPA: phosphodiester glycosidase family protein [Thermoanaerobaculia bacterium]|nr:phosphodiester glycosidase family protein [Thermoanaerobaculia bacterium]
MPANLVRSVALLLALLAAGSAAPPAPIVHWQPLQKGVELAIIPLAAAGGSGSFYVVRVDPRLAHLQVALASETGAGPRTAGEWCRRAGLSVAINVGMFQTDQKSNVGYLRHGTHLNNGRWNAYRSVLAARPKDPSLPALLWRDLDQSNATADLSRYEIVVQNLRLIAGKGKNVWSQSGKRWSEAAVAADSDGHLLFLFSRAPYSMRDFNELLLKLPLNVTQAMHVEGGPEASLSIHTASVNLDLCGSYETGFRLDDTNRDQWPIPNVLGVAREDVPSAQVH